MPRVGVSIDIVIVVVVEHWVCHPTRVFTLNADTLRLFFPELNGLLEGGCVTHCFPMNFPLSMSLSIFCSRTDVYL